MIGNPLLHLATPMSSNLVPPPILGARRYATALVLIAAFSACAPFQTSAQVTDTAGYAPAACPSCAEWNTPTPPVHLHGSTYYVGTRGLGAILIASPEGHILIDGGLPNSAPHILENVRTLGFRVEDIRLIMTSHVHYDHAGGVAALQRASGAEVAALPKSAAVLRTGLVGSDDPQHAIALPFPPVSQVRVVAHLDTVRVGPLRVVAHATPGHTPGGTTWSWQSCVSGTCLDFVYADSQTPVSADGFLYSQTAAYPGVLADFERSARTLEGLSCDVLITPHPGASNLWGRLAGREGATLVDRGACRRYAASARAALARRLETEKR